MEVTQTITSAIKKTKGRNVRSKKKKRLTFEDEVSGSQAEERPKLKEPVQVITPKKTNFLTFGLCLIKSFSQQGLDIVGVTYNSRSRRLILADGRGLCSLDLIPSNSFVKREMIFQKYQFNMVRTIIYAEKYNVYFILQKDYAIKVYNREYKEICSLENPISQRIIFMSFNPLKDEVITGRVKGVKTWKFKEKKIPDYTNAGPMLNYSLFPSTEYPHMGNKWWTNMEFDVIMQRYYCFSDCHFFCYDIQGNMLLEIPNAHQSAILYCVYSRYASILLTSSKGSEIKSWNEQGCLLNIFQSHTKMITQLLLHPINTSLFISGSLDGSVKLWSFDTMDLFYSISLFPEGIFWIGPMHDKFLYCCSPRSLHVYDLNSFTNFWTHVNSPLNNLYLCSADGKSSRVVAMGVDNSLRIFSLHDGTKLCTVLPPPYPSGFQPILSFAYNRANGTIYFLLTPWDIWIYTARTDPACRAAVWTIGELQQHLHRKHPLASCAQKNEYFQHTRKKNFRTTAKCECLCSLSSPLCYLIDEGVVYADNQEFLVLGMQDGRILFLHTSIQNLVYYEMTVYKDPVIHLKHDVADRQLIIMLQGPKGKVIHFRSLPTLELIFHVDATNETTVFTRLDCSVFVGLKSGAIDVLNIVTEDQIMFAENKINNNGENEQKDESCCSENYHQGLVVAVDCCTNLSIFLSCGSDYMIKLWDIQKNLLAEISLDNTLSTACFLNISGDILLAFKGDLYILPHSKALGPLKTKTDTSRVSATESFIFESQPSDEQEKEKTTVSKPIEIESYLVPYTGFAFTDDFTSELQVLPMKKKKPSWKLAVAPSKVYCSPCASEASLKLFDFLLQPRSPNVEEQDKAELSERMTVTEDMKYVPGAKPTRQIHGEIPFFGVSPCSSVVHEHEQLSEGKLKDEVPELESELSFVESLQATPSAEQQQFNEETAPETTEIMSENYHSFKKTQILEPLLKMDSFVYEKGKGKRFKGDSQLFSSRDKKHMSKKPHRKENLGAKKIRTSKHAISFSVSKRNFPASSKDNASFRNIDRRSVIAKKRAEAQSAQECITLVSNMDAVRCTDHSHALHTRSAISVGEKVFPALATEGSIAAQKRPLLRKKAYQQKREDEESPYERSIIKEVTWRKENEKIQHTEEQHILLDLRKRLCSRSRCCFTPSNSQLFSAQIDQNTKFPENSSETELIASMKPHGQLQSHRRPYTVMEETTITIPRDFPYRLAWGTPTTTDLDVRLYHPRMKSINENKIPSRGLDKSKSLQPTKSIPNKGRFIIVNEPLSSTSTAPLSPLESKLLSARFPRQKAKILRSLCLEMQDES